MKDAWPVKRVSWLFRRLGSGTTPDTSNPEYFDGDMPWVNTGDLNDDVLNTVAKAVSAKAIADYSALKVYHSDTLLIALYGATIGKLGILKKDSVVNQACFAMCGPIGVESKFVFYWMLANRLDIIARAYGGGQPNISGEIIKGLRIATPPLEEQHAIAEFLDRKTAQIDGVIAKKRRMIDLLHEKRQALVSEAVTKGLDPDVPTKDSGIEWLGRVPRHWSVERLKWRMRKIEQGWSPQCDSRQADPDEWGVLKVGCMNSGRYDESENKALPADLPPLPELEVQVGDVLMSRSNTVELVGCVGRVHQTQGKILVCDKLYRLVFASEQLDPEYAVLVLRSHSARLQIERDASGASASMKNISNEVVTDLVLAFPPLDEQREIVAAVTSRLGLLRRMEHLVVEQITKLREYRQTLISAAVTGQIDVTGEGQP